LPDELGVDINEGCFGIVPPNKNIWVSGEKDANFDLVIHSCAGAEPVGISHRAGVGGGQKGC
jgi:hypothetical protein